MRQYILVSHTLKFKSDQMSFQQLMLVSTKLIQKINWGQINLEKYILNIET